MYISLRLRSSVSTPPRPPCSTRLLSFRSLFCSRYLIGFCIRDVLWQLTRGFNPLPVEKLPPIKRKVDLRLDKAFWTSTNSSECSGTCDFKIKILKMYWKGDTILDHNQRFPASLLQTLRTVCPWSAVSCNIFVALCEFPSSFSPLMMLSFKGQLFLVT